VATGYASCTAVTTKADLKATSWVRGSITNVVCDSGYVQTDLSTCTDQSKLYSNSLDLSNSVVTTTVIPSTGGCADGFAYKSSTGKCVTCIKTGVLTCNLDSTFNEVIVSCKTNYYWSVNNNVCIPC